MNIRFYFILYNLFTVFSDFLQPEEEIFPSLILAESCETRSCDIGLSPASSPHVQNAGSQPTQKGEDILIYKYRSFKNCCNYTKI